ncbi:MAG: hypothetical protein HC866_13655 [Leptolyngbyaceae cyanobacterium RU_5_1]|nr:hypothetical protein [Leptolyngbyaceae cyanobacterium RU_5_1]
MNAVEFQAKIENGVITVPEEYKQELVDGEIVTVTVSKRSRKQTLKRDIIDELTENPVTIPGIRSMTREQMHER